MKLISISVFDAPDSIREKYNIGVKERADAAGLPQPRISELRRLKKEKEGVRTGRAFTPEKCVCCVGGLKGITGENNMKKELLNQISKFTTDREKNLIILNHGISQHLNKINNHIVYLSKYTGTSAETLSLNRKKNNDELQEIVNYISNVSLFESSAGKKICDMLHKIEKNQNELTLKTDGFNKTAPQVHVSNVGRDMAGADIKGKTDD